MAAAGRSRVGGCDVTCIRSICVEWSSRECPALRSTGEKRYISSWAFTSSPIHSIWPKDRFIFHRFKLIDLARSFTEAPKCTIGRFDPPYSPFHTRGGFRSLERASSPPRSEFSSLTPTHISPTQPHTGDLSLASKDHFSLL
ncbi:hypothetical protein AVEN_102799-1 [Araneus ventricosus]|uniref:Uncharacterized protein n=1 Tax=Araneus ventricosus TaxID=182803 RepID=A0A4Y2IJ15_ARAVE|nr:hypothetical protein AVEN_102799-1 [Araneus ventricosus]